MTAPPRCSVPGCLRLRWSGDSAGRCFWCSPGTRDQCDFGAADRMAEKSSPTLAPGSTTDGPDGLQHVGQKIVDADR